MNYLPFAAAIWLLLIGLYGVATSRNTIHLVSSLFVAQSSTYLLLLSIGYRTGGTAPIFTGAPKGVAMVDPVVQALALTDVVVGAAVSALILVFAVQSHKRTKSEDPSRNPPQRG